MINYKELLISKEYYAAIEKKNQVYYRRTLLSSEKILQANIYSTMLSFVKVIENIYMCVCVYIYIMISIKMLLLLNEN